MFFVCFNLNLQLYMLLWITLSRHVFCFFLVLLLEHHSSRNRGDDHEDGATYMLITRFNRGDSFPYGFEPNGFPSGSKLKGKLSPRSDPIQFERK